VRVTGTIIRFDDVRGYGFISPDAGGEDVFLHVNDLEMDKPQARAGARVSFQIAEKDKGKFATGVRLAPDTQEVQTKDDGAPDSYTDDYYDVLSVAEFKHVVTELLLQLDRPVAGDQIVAIRAGLEALARKHRWIEP
jgi:CspA family cold shock protein